MSRRSGAISSIDAAGARWNGQPEARQEWPCHQVAAFSLVGTARRRAEAGALAYQGHVCELDPRQTTLTLRSTQVFQLACKFASEVASRSPPNGDPPCSEF